MRKERRLGRRDGAGRKGAIMVLNLDRESMNSILDDRYGL
jgi:hypothetical protein